MVLISLLFFSYALTASPLYPISKNTLAPHSSLIKSIALIEPDFISLNLETIRSYLTNLTNQELITKNTVNNVMAWLSDTGFTLVKENGQNAHEFILGVIQQENWKDLNDRFFKKIEPGTAGMRDRMGVGSALINEATIGMFAQAHANYLVKHPLKGRKGIVIGGDSRHGSYDPETKGPGYLQKMVAEIYAAAGIPVYLSDKPLPTPVVSFSIGEMEFQLGELPISGAINTASHNPKEDNGYKIYEVDGHQVVNADFKKDLQKEITKIDSFSKVNRLKNVSWPGKDAIDSLGNTSEFKKDKVRKLEVSHNLFIVSSYDIIEQYRNKVRQVAIRTNENEGKASQDDSNFYFTKEILDAIAKQKIVITALNGNLWPTCKALLEKHGLIEGIHFFGVPKEITPDGNFPVGIGTPKEGKPNPESPEVFNRAKEYAKEKGAKYIFASDPDSDRIGIAFYDATTKSWVHLTGNEQLSIAAA